MTRSLWDVRDHRSTRTRLLGLLAGAAAVLFLNVVQFLVYRSAYVSPDFTSGLLVSATLTALLLVIAVWAPGVASIGSLLLLAGHSAMLLGPAALGARQLVFVFVADWIGRRRPVPAALLVLGAVVVRAATGYRLSSLLLGLVPATAMAVAAGVVLLLLQDRESHLHERIKAAEVAARLARSRVDADITAILHDGVASDLTYVLLLTRLAAGESSDDAARARLREIEQRTSSALGQVRGLLTEGRRTTTGGVDALDDAVEDCRHMLAARRITLVTETDDAPRTSEVDTFLELLVRECSVNALKYAPSACEATLLIEAGSGTVDFLFSTPVAQASALTGGVLSSGAGLALLRARAEVLGGTVAAGRVGERWVVSGSVAGVTAGTDADHSRAGAVP